MAMELGKQVGQKIRQHREARGLTQAQLASLLGKSVETISNFERGKVVTGLMTLDQLSRHLNVRVVDFFDDNPISLPTEQLSEAGTKVRNAITLLPDDDLEIVAGLVDVLEARRRRLA